MKTFHRFRYRLLGITIFFEIIINKRCRNFRIRFRLKHILKVIVGDYVAIVLYDSVMHKSHAANFMRMCICIIYTAMSSPSGMTYATCRIRICITAYLPKIRDTSCTFPDISLSSLSIRHRYAGTVVPSVFKHRKTIKYNIPDRLLTCITYDSAHRCLLDIHTIINQYMYPSLILS